MASQEPGEGGVSPKAEGELRCSAIENKATTTQSADSTMKQLKANMLLCAVDQLTKLFKDPGSKADAVKQLKCYVQCMFTRQSNSSFGFDC